LGEQYSYIKNECVQPRKSSVTLRTYTPQLTSSACLGCLIVPALQVLASKPFLPQRKFLRKKKKRVLTSLKGLGHAILGNFV